MTKDEVEEMLKERQALDDQIALLAVEFGYVCATKGISFTAAIEQYKREIIMKRAKP